MPPRQAVLGMEHASFFYGSQPGVRNVSFLLDGDRMALVGDNGAGKSTLLSALAAAYDPELEHYDGRRRCASTRPAGWSISTRPCATCRSTRRSSTTCWRPTA